MLKNMAEAAKFKLGILRSIQKQRERVCEAAKDHFSNPTEESEASLYLQVSKLQRMEAEL